LYPNRETNDSPDFALMAAVKANSLLEDTKMNEKTTQHEMEKQGWIRRLLTAVGRKCFACLCVYEVGMSPAEAHMFLSEGGFFCDGISDVYMGQSLARMKWD
jgi:hypothetical protein